MATDAAGTVEILKAAYAHKGAAVCEILQNCVIFNDGTHDTVYTKEGRAKHAIYLEHGQPMLFGENKEFGLMQEGIGLKVVKIGENGVTEKDILVHDAHCQDNTLHLKLALMEGPDFPVALGVIRDVEAPTYDEAVNRQIEEVKEKKAYHNFTELLYTNDIWEVKELAPRERERKEKAAVPYRGAAAFFVPSFCFDGRAAGCRLSKSVIFACFYVRCWFSICNKAGIFVRQMKYQSQEIGKSFT